MSDATRFMRKVSAGKLRAPLNRHRRRRCLYRHCCCYGNIVSDENRESAAEVNFY